MLRSIRLIEACARDITACVYVCGCVVGRCWCGRCGYGCVCMCVCMFDAELSPGAIWVDRLACVPIARNSGFI